MDENPTFETITPLIPSGKDFPEGLAFFIDELGFDCLWKSETMAGIRRGQVNFLLVQSADQHWADNTSASIGVRHLDRLYEKYKHVPAEVGPLEMKAWGRREFHMRLPSGVCLQFYETAIS